MKSTKSNKCNLQKCYLVTIYDNLNKNVKLDEFIFSKNVDEKYDVFSFLKKYFYIVKKYNMYNKPIATITINIFYKLIF